MSRSWKKVLSLALALVMTISLAGFAAADGVTPGTYVGSATGGFGRNQELAEELAPTAYMNYTAAQIGDTGDGIVMARGNYGGIVTDYEGRVINGEDEAVFALAMAYRRFAQEHPELYRIILAMQHMDNNVLEREASVLADTVMQALGDFDLTEEELMHWQRILRSLMHGFIAHEEAGYFIHFAADKEDTYRLGIQCFLDGLKHRAKR